MKHGIERARTWWNAQHILRRVVLGYVILIALPMLVIGIVVNTWVNASVLARASESMSDRIEQWRSAIMTSAAQIESIGEVLQYNSGFTRYLAGDIRDRAERVIQYRQEVEPLLAFARALNSHVTAIDIYTRDGTVASLGSDINPWEELTIAVRERAGVPGYVGEWQTRLPIPDPDRSNALNADQLELRYYRVLYDDLLARPVAVARVSVSPSIVTESIASVTGLGTTASVSPGVRRLNGPGPTAALVITSAEESTLGPKGSTLTHQTIINEPDLSLMLSTPRRELLRDLLPVRLLAAAAVPLFTLLLSLIYYVIYYSWSRRIVELTDHIRHSSHDKLEKFTEGQTNDEVGLLVHHYNELVERIRTLLNSLRIAEIRQKEAAFRSLLSQMNPHFLYNALESIRMMAEAGRSEAAAEMTFQLGQFSRYSLSDTSMISTVREEAEHVKHYLAIHRSRMGERLQFFIEINSEAEQAPCPRFVIQPIVENCVKHGIGGRRTGGRVEVDASVRRHGLQITVRDNGIGMNSETLAAVSAQLEVAGESALSNAFSTTQESGIGLANVHQRVIAFAGAGSGLSVESEPGDGTTVSVLLRSAVECRS